MRVFLVAMLCLSAVAGQAEGADPLAEARRLMQKGQFADARATLLAPAQAGEALAEDLLATIHALGLGVEQDYVRAMEWRRRAAIHGLASAQADLGWYYERGLGGPPDFVRAYVWYVLAAIGGDPEAALNQAEVFRRMNATEVKRAHRLIDDYRGWLYPGF